MIDLTYLGLGLTPGFVPRWVIPLPVHVRAILWGMDVVPGKILRHLHDLHSFQQIKRLLESVQLVR